LLFERLSSPRVEDVCHERHPFFRSTLEVVLDRPVSERDEIVLFTVRRNRNVLVVVSLAFAYLLRLTNSQPLSGALSLSRSCPTRCSARRISIRYTRLDIGRPTHCASLAPRIAVYQRLSALSPRALRVCRPISILVRKRTQSS
jgi:hypothetical protein